MKTEKKEYLKLAVDIVLLECDAIRTSSDVDGNPDRDNTGGWIWGDNK